MARDLSKEQSIVNQYLHELRDKACQKDRMRFMTNVERMGSICGYEISKDLDYQSNLANTQFGVAKTQVLRSVPVVATVLRAGLPFHAGILKIFDKADSAFIGARRVQSNAQTITTSVSYVACPKLSGRVLVIADTMIATGTTLVDSYKLLLKNGTPIQTFITAITASQAGITLVEKHIPNAHIIVGAIDDELNQDFRIVPGLGDAGDLLYGENSVE